MYAKKRILPRRILRLRRGAPAPSSSPPQCDPRGAFLFHRNEASYEIKKPEHLMLRANVSSVLPPKFRENLSALCRHGYPLTPIPLPCNAGSRWSLLSAVSSALFSPLLEGYFHNSLTKIRTLHLLSLHRQTVYSSLSLHFLYRVKTEI